MIANQALTTSRQDNSSGQPQSVCTELTIAELADLYDRIQRDAITEARAQFRESRFLISVNGVLGEIDLQKKYPNMIYSVPLSADDQTTYLDIPPSVLKDCQPGDQIKVAGFIKPNVYR